VSGVRCRVPRRTPTPANRRTPSPAHRLTPTPARTRTLPDWRPRLSVTPAQAGVQG